MRLHPYLTKRILDRAPGPEAEAALAANHHERQDGSVTRAACPAPN